MIPVDLAARSEGGLFEVRVILAETVCGYLMKWQAVIMLSKMAMMTVIPQRRIQDGLRPIISCR